MIYFLQDSSDSAIKIGYTGEDTPTNRQRACQTGNPRPLIVLAAVPGSQNDEADLHRRFVGDRLHGEWFRPSPAILQFIIQATTAQAVAVVAPGTKRPEPEDYLPTWPLTIYLAGKISVMDWRNPIVNADISDGEILGVAWQISQNAIFDLHHYAGPYFVWDNHRSTINMGDDTHGAGADRSDFEVETLVEHEEPSDFAKAQKARATLIGRLCASSIKASDLVFAWISQLDCYGTISEIGYAAALGKMIWIAGPRRFRDMWFVYQHASRIAFRDDLKPEDVLRDWLTEHRRELAESHS